MKHVKLKEREMQISTHTQIEFFYSFGMTQLIIPGRIFNFNITPQPPPRLFPHMIFQPHEAQTQNNRLHFSTLRISPSVEW